MPKTTYSIRIDQETKDAYLAACTRLDIAHADLTAEMMRGAIMIAADPDHPAHPRHLHLRRTPAPAELDPL